LLDEMALTSSGYAEPTTGARAGRLLQAEHVFQGVLTTLGDSDLQTDADVLNIPRSASAGTLTEAAALEGIFDMEKQIVIRTIEEVLGVALTPAEEQAILENRMSNVLAFLAYGRGLREIDRGNYAGAQAEFDLSVQLEPGGFASRSAAMGELANLLDASAVRTTDLSGIAINTGELGLGAFGPPSAATTQDLAFSTSARGTTPAAGTLQNVMDAVAPRPTTGLLDRGSTGTGREQISTSGVRDPVQESGGTETLPGTVDAQITIVIQRPGGE
jgi:hypothetical protein